MAFDPNATYIRNVYGLLELAGAEPIGGSNIHKAPDKWNFWGKEFATGADGRLSVKDGGPALTGAGKLTAGVSIGTSVLSVIMGAASGGFGGAFSALASEIAANKAISQHAYTVLKDGKIRYGGSHGLLGKVIHRSGIGGIPGLGPGLRGARYLGQSVGANMGAGIGGAIGGAVFGPIGMIVGTGMGANFGARSPWRLAGAMLLGGAASLAYNGAASTLKLGYAHAQSKKALETDGSLAAFYTNSAFTMRSRAVEAMSKSHLNARSALGQEATYMHRPYRNYNSTYRSAW